MKKTQKHKARFFHAHGLFLLIAAFAFTNNLSGVPPAICDEKEGHILDNSKIKLLDSDCTETDEICIFLISAPLEVERRDFKSFVFLRLEYQEVVMYLNLSHAINNGFAETILYGARQLMKNVEVRAVYEIEESCSLHSVLKFSDKIK